MSHNIKSLKQRFLEYIEIEKGRSLNTVENYDRYLTRFASFLKSDNPAAITESSVREYRLWLNRQSNGRKGAEAASLKKKTQSYHLIALRAFLKYLSKQGLKTLSPEYIELPKTGDRHIDLISAGELEDLLNVPEGDGLRALRDRAILRLLFSTGLRVSELCSLTRDIDFDAESFSVRGKGEKIRVVFLSDDARKAVKRYLSKRTDVDDALFVKTDGSKEKAANEGLGLTKRSIERIVKQCAIKAGISKKVTPHVIRHCFATDLLANGADLRSVQMILGHANINTTQIYTHFTDTHLQKVHKQFHNRKKYEV
jgi:site-specific recombinase XerD